MNEQIAVRDDRQIQQALTANEVISRVKKIQEIVKHVMKEGEHYGVIPGCKKPSLYKSGAELLLMTFQVASKVDRVEDLSTPDEIRYRVTVAGIHQTTGAFLGDHVGECSSSEEKYKWRRPVCDQEFNDTPEDRRRVKWAIGKNNTPYQQKQIRTNPADVANTILSMGEKRGMVGMTRSVTGASSMFTDGVEDLPPEMVDGAENQKPEIKPPQSKSASAKPTEQPPPAQSHVEEFISDKQRSRLFAICSKQNVSQETLRDYLREKYRVEHSNEIFRADYDKICQWAENGGQETVTE